MDILKGYKVTAYSQSEIVYQQLAGDCTERNMWLPGCGLSMSILPNIVTFHLFLFIIQAVKALTAAECVRIKRVEDCVKQISQVN